MGGVQGILPMLVEELVSFHARIERCQQAWRPHQPFHPRPTEQKVSGGQSVSVFRSRCRHWRRSHFALVCRVHHASISLRPFAPPELPGFNATMNALTPERQARRYRDRLALLSRSGLLVSRIKSSSHSVSNHPLSFSKFGLVSLRDLPPREPLRLTHPLGRVPLGVTWASPLSSRLATTTGRIEFVILRTDHSPPDALHPVSRRRSFVRIQSSNPTLMRTRTSLT